MMENLSLETSILVNAPATKVWEAITNPDLVKQYFFGTNVISDWEVGSPIIFKGEWEGKKYEDKGTILEIEPEKLLKYNYWSNFSSLPDKPENYSTILYTLSEKDGQTTLMVSQDNIASQEAKEHSESNWQTVLQNMKKLVESKN